MYRSGEDRRSRVSRGLVVSDVILGFKKKIITISKSLKKTGKRLRFWIRGLVNVLTNFPESLMCLVDPFKARDCFARSCVM